MHSGKVMVLLGSDSDGSNYRPWQVRENERPKAL